MTYRHFMKVLKDTKTPEFNAKNPSHFDAHAKSKALGKKRTTPAHKTLGLSHREWVAEGKPKAHY